MMKTKSILFVCLGNICRSPMAETIFEKQLSDRGIDGIRVDSAGLLDYHQGELADPRMRSNAEQRGYHITHHSRPVSPQDFQEFDLIVGMDDQNIRGLMDMATSDEERAKIVKMTTYAQTHNVENVPDPYYGGAKGFSDVIELLEDSCRGLLDVLMQE